MPFTLLHDEARTRGRRRSYHSGAQFRDSWACPNLVSMKVYAFLSLLDVLKPWGFIYYKPERLTENFEITTFSNIFVCNISLFSGFGTTRKSQFQRLFVVIRAANPGSINCLMTTILKKFEWELFFFHLHLKNWTRYTKLGQVHLSISALCPLILNDKHLSGIYWSFSTVRNLTFFGINY